jgi:hypothetical protein
MVYNGATYRLVYGFKFHNLHYLICMFFQRYSIPLIYGIQSKPYCRVLFRRLDNHHCEESRNIGFVAK